MHKQYKTDQNQLNKKSAFKLISHSGFTLLEVMVAMSIIALVITGVFRLQSQSIYMSNEARFYTTAPFLLQKVLTEYEKDPDGLSDSSGDFGDEFAGYTWTRKVEDIESEALGEDFKEMKSIDVTVLADDGVYSYNIRAYRFIQENDKE